MRRAWLASLTVAVLIAPALLSSQTVPDFTKAREEVVATLQALVRIDTSNPPGNETKVAE